MQISVNIEDEKLNEILKAGIENADKDVVGRLATAALEKAFSDENIVGRMLFKVVGEYGGKVTFGEPRDWVENAVVKAITSEDMAKWRAAFLDIVDRNWKCMIMSALAEVFASNLFTFQNQCEFSRSFSDAIKRDLKESL